MIVEDSEDEEKEAEDSDTMNDSDADELGTINCRLFDAACKLEEFIQIKKICCALYCSPIFDIFID